MFGKKSVGKTNVDSLFLQLIVLEIIVLNARTGGVGMAWELLARGNDRNNPYSDAPQFVQNISWARIKFK